MKTLLLIWNNYGIETKHYLIKTNNEEEIKKLLSCNDKIVNSTPLEDDDFTYALSYLTDVVSDDEMLRTPEEELAVFGLKTSDIGSYAKYQIEEKDLLNINQHIDHIVIAGIY